MNNESLTTKVSVKETLLTVLFLGIYFFSNTFLVISGTITIAALGLIAILVMMLQKSIIINKRFIGIVLILCVNVVATTLFMKESTDYAIILVIFILYSFVVISSVEFKLFARIYTRTMFIAGLFSILVYFCMLVFPDIIKAFPLVLNINGYAVHNVGLAYASFRGAPLRNMGFFWEPGAFQTFLVFAMLFEIFVFQMRRKWNIIVFILAIITTWSTAGIINLLVLASIMVLYLNQGKRNRYVNVFVVLVMSATVLLWIYSNLPTGMQYAVFGKVARYFGNETSSFTSASVRFDSITIPIVSFFSSPLFGVGVDGLKDAMSVRGHNMTTNTILNWFAVYGGIYGTLMLISLIKLAQKLAVGNRFLIVLVFISIALSISSEQYLRNMSVILILFLSYSTSPVQLEIEVH